MSPDECELKAQIEFFGKLTARFEAAKKCGVLHNHCYAVGPYTVALNFVNDVLESQLCPAFEHLHLERGTTPDLTILIWDSASTGIDMVRSPWKTDAICTHGKIRGYNSDRFQTALSLVSGALSMLDLEKNRAVWWVRDAASLQMPEKGSPVLAILDWWLSRRGIHYIHSGAVGTADGGVLLMGKGNAGKSTTAISCVTSKLKYLADDYCLLTHNPEPYVYSVYNSGKLDDASVRRLSALDLNFVNSGKAEDEKNLAFIYRDYPKYVIREFPVKAILLPEVTGDTRSRVVPISSAEAFRTIGPNNLFQFTGEKNGTFHSLVRLVNRVPSFRLYVGRDSVDTRRRIREVI